MAVGRRAKNPRACIVITSTPSWLKTSLVVKTVPRFGFVDDGCESVTVTRALQAIAGAHRRRPAHLFDARRAHRGRVEQDAAHEQTHEERPGVPPARDQPVERPVRRRDRIDVERLRVVTLREREDLLLGHLDLAELGHVTNVEVLPVAHRP